MVEIKLPMEEWQKVLGILAQAQWALANPLIMAIGEQLRQGAEMAAKREGAVRPNGEDRPASQ